MMMGLHAVLLSVALAVPFVAQHDNTCAAASLTMVLRYWGDPATEEEIVTALPRSAGGVPGSGLEALAKARGLFAQAYAGDLAQLRGFVGKGRPLIVALGAGPSEFHDVVVIGSEDDGALLVNDPAIGARRKVSASEFEKRWSVSGHWTLLVLPKGP